MIDSKAQDERMVATAALPSRDGSSLRVALSGCGATNLSCMSSRRFMVGFAPKIHLQMNSTESCNEISG